MKLPVRQARTLFALIMSGLMSLLMSAFITVVTVGFAAFPQPWFNVWLIAWASAFPLILMLSPLVHRMVGALTH